MKDWQSQAHVKWDCKDHVVIVPKYRQRVFFGKRRKQIWRDSAEPVPTDGSRCVEGERPAGSHPHAVEHSPKYSVAMTIGFLKGKSAVRNYRELMKTRGTLFGRSFWSRGNCVSTVGLDEALIRRYIQDQEKHERDQERGLFDDVE